MRAYRDKRERAIKQLKDLRDSALKLLGGKCELCGWAKRLHLAHKDYWPDSASSKEKDMTRRVKEAIAHPECFHLLCYTCHRAYDLIKRYRGLDIFNIPKQP